MIPELLTCGGRKRINSQKYTIMILKYIRKTLSIALVSIIFCGCSDWTEIEAINSNSNLSETTKTDEYYAALRAWKQTPNLPQVFVWFDNWSGASPTGANSLRGLPDSVTIASNWGGHPKFNLTPERKADMEYVQKVKGTKVVVTLFSANVGDDVPHQDIFETAGNSSDPEVVRPAIKAYAEALYDCIVEAGYDGFDWDYEPETGKDKNHLWNNITQRRIFVEELSYWFGKGSQRTDRGDRKPAKPGLLFLIDCEIGIGDHIEKDWPMYYVDYYVLQAYGARNESSLDSRVNGVFNDMSKWIEEGKLTKEEIVRRTIVTEDFESHASKGGGFLIMSNYVYKQQGIEQQIGGCGIYRVGFDYNQGDGDYNGSPEYYYLRQGITNLYRTYHERLNISQEENSSEQE